MKKWLAAVFAAAIFLNIVGCAAIEDRPPPASGSVFSEAFVTSPPYIETSTPTELPTTSTSAPTTSAVAPEELTMASTAENVSEAESTTPFQNEIDPDSGEKSAPPSMPPQTIDGEIPTERVVYLTFDDGPSRNTERLLDILDKYNIKATFFVINSSHSDIIAEEFKRGHSVGIHCYTHDYRKVYADEDAYFADLDAIQDEIVKQTGERTTLLRFPGGSSNTASCFNRGIMTRLTEAVAEKGFTYFDWNVSSGDAGRATETEQVVENVINGIKKHNISVVLQHDPKSFSVDAVEEIIIWGLENGYTFLPLTHDSPTCHHSVAN